MSQGDSTVVVKSFSLSQKEEKLKNKLFANGGQTQKKNQNIQMRQAPPNSQNVQWMAQQQQQQQQKQQQQQQQQQQPQQEVVQPQNGNNQSQFQQIYNQIPEQKIDQFLKQMENELNNINKKQVSIGMLNSQTQIFKEQNEVLNENQKQLAILMNKLQNDDQIIKHKQELADQNRNILKELLLPINEQIQEIKQIYNKTKLSQKEVYNQIEKSSTQNPQLNQNLKEVQNANSSLKNKLESANSNLNGFLPENMSAFANMTNFNIDIYSKTINNLKNQIQELQKDAQRAEFELEERQQKLNRLPKQQELLIPFQEDVQAQVENIDFVSSRQIVNNKLGGEVDYDDFCQQLNEFSTDAEALWREYQQNMAVHSIFIPQVSVTQNELNDLSYRMPSVLEDIKVKLGLDPTKPMKNPILRVKQRDQQQNYIDMARQDPDPTTNYAKGKSQKPKNLETLKSEPKQCQREIQFEKRDSVPKYNQFDTLLVDKQDQQQKKVQNSLSHIPDITKPVPYPKITQASNTQLKQYDNKHSNATSMSEIKRKTSGSGFNQSQNKIQQSRKTNIKGVDRNMEEEFKQYEENQDDYENYLQIQMDQRIVKNIVNPYADQQQQYTFQKKFMPEDNVAITLDNNNIGMAMPQQPIMDRQTLKSIFLEVLHENKETFFGNLINDNPNQNQDQNNSDQEQLLTNQSNENGRRRLSDFIKKDQQTSPIKTSRSNNNNANQNNSNNNNANQNKRDSFMGDNGGVPAADQMRNPNIQQQSQDLALNFLNVINSTLAQVNAGINKPQAKNQQIGLDIQDISEGSLDDDSMEAGVQGRKGQQFNNNNNNNNFNQQSMYGQGMGRQQQQQPPFSMTLNPYQQQQQQQQQMMMPGMTGMGGMPIPMPIYPGMMMPSTWMMPPMAPQQNNQNYNNNNMNNNKMNNNNLNNKNNNQDLNDTRINLNDYYREFQLSDTDTVVNQSSISMSQYDAKSNRSYADSIFQSNDQSRSEGQVSVPGRKSIGNIKVQNDYYLSNNKSAGSQGELSQSHEISQDYSRRKSVQKVEQKQNKNQGSKFVGDDIWKDISDEFSEGQI